MKNTIGCCIFCLGAGFVAGAMLTANNNNVRKWFSSSTQKINDAYSEIMQKVDSTLGGCTCGQSGHGQSEQKGSDSAEKKENESGKKSKKSN